MSQNWFVGTCTRLICQILIKACNQNRNSTYFLKILKHTQLPTFKPTLYVCMCLTDKNWCFILRLDLNFSANLYHYTNKNASESIQETEVLKQSTNTIRDAILGPGVYFTSIAPGVKPPIMIVKNNWDGNYTNEQLNQFIQEGMIDYVVKVSVTRADKSNVFKSIQQFDKNSTRDVYVYSDDLYLNSSNFKFEIKRFEDFVSSGMKVNPQGFLLVFGPLALQLIGTNIQKAAF